MSKRKKRSKRRKNLAISAFGLSSVADRYETAPLYQRKLQESDMQWLADEYQRRSSSEPSLTLEELAAQYGVPADELRSYVPELGEGISHSVIVWHGTSRSRAKSIRKEGFRPRGGKNGQIFFTRNPAVARRYAQARARRERDKPVVIMCSIDLSHYNGYERRDGNDAVVVFTHKCIAGEVIKKVTGLPKQHREKLENREDASVRVRTYGNTRLPNVALTFNSERAAIAYWVNSYLKLNGRNRIHEGHEVVVKIGEWLNAQVSAGRFGEVPDDEILEQVREYLPQYLP